MAKQNKRKGSSQSRGRIDKKKSRQEEVVSSEEKKDDTSISEEKIPRCEVITIKDDESEDEVLCEFKTENTTKSKHAAKRVKRQQDVKERAPVPGEPDGLGGLDQGATFVAEYSKTSRATCKRCDIRIKKGELRIGHRPLFRGKPGYQIFKHLECIVFSEDILCAEDVAGYDQLTDEDYLKLAKRVHSSQDEIKKESQELEPDELVQKQFDGEIRETPIGFVGNLLPFQIEGLSWMYNQEVNMKNVRGGILADEMGMGKTIQTIATILDNRPKLQQSIPGSKHPPCSDEERAKLFAEESLWDDSLSQWKNEMKMNDVHQSILPVAKKGRVGGGARAGTLVVCPVIALSQWKTEIEKFCESNALSVLVYHGPDRTKLAPRELLVKYDVVLTTYQVIEVDFRKMISPNRVKCPNCGNKFKIDKLPIHLKYFCGENAQRTDAQARTIRNSERGGNSRSRGNRDSDKQADKKVLDKKIHSKQKIQRKPKLKKEAAPKFKRGKSKRGAALKARKSLYFEDDSGDESSFSEFEVASEDSEEETDFSSSDTDDSPAMKRAKLRQMEAFKTAKTSKGKTQRQTKGNMKQFKNEKKSFAKKKKDDSDDEDSDNSSDGPDYLDGIDMDNLIKEAMAGAQMSPLHSLCWWRVVLDEAHFIKSRSSQTSASAFSLTAIHRWCLSGTPLQNRVGEFYSLVRFLRLDPMAHYMCRAKDCSCKSIHYRMVNGKCKDCGHGSIQHYSHFNKHILNPIQRDGYAHDGRRAMFTLKNEILDKCLLRRTKETRAEDMNLPPRNVTIKAVRLHPVEEDFYNALYTQTSSSFNDYVADGTLLNNYAHIFDLLMRMRQAVSHPYLVIHSKKGVNQPSSAPIVSNGRTDCEICHEPPTERVTSTCCNSCFCRSCVIEYTESSVGDSTNCPHCNEPLSIDLNDIQDDVVDDSTLTVKSENMPLVSTVGLPSLKELPHVATGSILRKIDLTKYATSTKIESLCAELVEMRRRSPGSKAIVFSQFVNMLDLIRWRLHSDPFLVDLGLGARAIHGGMDVKARDEVLKDFRENPNVRVLLMSLKAGGVALNLTVANYIYIMDPWWNPAAEMQAIDRTHRLGQHRPIRAVRFIAENTVEERILQLQEKKRLVFDGTVGRDAGSLKMLTVDDMKSLFA